MGIIDTISAGFRLVTRRLWLVALPIALDLFLLLGPKLSVLPVMTQALDNYVALQEALPQESVQTLNAEMIASLHELVNDVLGPANLLAVSAWTRLGFPSVAGARPIDAAVDTVHTITTNSEMYLWVAALLLLGLLLASAFLVLIAQALREGREAPADVVGHVVGSWLRLLVLFVPLGLGLLVASALLTLMPLGVGSLVMMALFVALIWATLYLAFVPEAITLAHASPLEAINSSFGIVRRNLASSVGLLVLVFVLRQGFGLIWGQLLQQSQLAAVVAILGSAYIGTALTAALFIFYHERLVRLRQQPEVRSIRL